MQSEAEPTMTKLAGVADAERLLEEVFAAMADLEVLLERETAEVRAGRLRQALAEGPSKTLLASAYLRGLEAVKSNAIALARFCPGSVQRLKETNLRFAGVIEANQAVLATARAVSEAVIKSLAEELDRGAQLQGYAPASMSQARPPSSGPLVLSRVL